MYELSLGAHTSSEYSCFSSILSMVASRKADIAMHIRNSANQACLRSHKATLHVWFFAEQLDSFGQHRVPTANFPLRRSR